MRVIGGSELAASLDIPGLVEALRQALRAGGAAPPAATHAVGELGTLAIECAAQPGRSIGVRVDCDFPGNEAAGLPARQGAYLLLDGATGRPSALLDGPALTHRRAAAVSALAALYLARPDCERLLLVGTGALAAHLVEAHAAVRPIVTVLVWGRDPKKAARLAKRLDRRNLRVMPTEDLAGAVRGAHVICCATAADRPLIRGAWLPLGVHLDLVGAPRPDQREVDDETLRRARVFLDARDGAALAAGDIAGPLGEGVIGPDDIAGDLVELARGSRAGRRFHDQITLFKAGGLPLADLAAARLALERART